MKRNFKAYFLFAIVMLGSAQGCNSILEEHPKTVFTNAFLQTTQGFQDGINAAYSYMRFQYGNNPSLGLNIVGTDEFTWGPEPSYQQGGDNLTHKQLGMYDINSQNGFLGVTFNRTFPILNSLNGLLQFAPTIPGLTDAQKTVAMAEIHYLRAHFYYVLVAQFGAQPLDLGSGDLKFNTTAFLGYNRLAPDLLKRNFQLMIDDLTYASQNLPDTRHTGSSAGDFKLSKAAALHLLSKIYLYRAYSSVTEDKNADFLSAYTYAKQLIDGQGTYGTALQSNYANIFKQGNDYNSEILFAAERIPKAQLNNGYPAGGPSGIGDLENMASSCFTSNYQFARLRAGGNPIDGRPFAFQRPLRKLCPTPWLLNVAFADKINDGRYHNSFRTLYTCDTQNAVGTAGYNSFVSTIAAFTPSLKLGDTAFVMTDTQAKADYINLVRKPYFIAYGPNDWYTPTKWPNAQTNPGVIPLYPALSKFVDAQRANPNDASGRPMPIFRLGETYLNAAEAAFQLGNLTDAATYINVIRTRAAANAGAVAAMQITAANLSLDFILDERARELCGEGGRWVDLAMRGDAVFLSRVNLNQDVAAAGKVQAFHRLRPIPQGQLDALAVPDKTIYQNPNY
jgi:hypothetical protein